MSWMGFSNFCGMTFRAMAFLPSNMTTEGVAGAGAGVEAEDPYFERSNVDVELRIQWT